MRLRFLLALNLLAPLASAQPRLEPAAPPAAAPAAELSITDAVVLGVVEGVTEFLPISSTGHLIIATKFLRLESDAPLVDHAGRTLWHKRPSEENPHGEPLTLKLAADTYIVVMQFGAIAAVALLYWPQFMAMLRGLFGRDPAGLRLLVNVIIAFLPAAVIGLLAHDWIDEHLFSVGTVIGALVAGAALMFFAERWRHRRLAQAAMGTSPSFAVDPERRGLAELTPRAALGIGVLQCLAMWPGMSRSMTTIVGGYFAGLDPRRSAEFSFLLGFVTLSAASVYKGYKSGTAMIDVFGWSSVLLGAVIAAVTAALCVKFLVHWLTRHGLGMFAWYRLVLAAVLIAVFYL